MIPQPYKDSQLIMNGWFSTETNQLMVAKSAQADKYHAEYLLPITKDVINSFPQPRTMVLESRRWAVFGAQPHYTPTFDLFMVLSRKERTPSMVHNATFYRHFDCPACGRTYPPVDANLFVDLTNKVVVADQFIAAQLVEWAKM